MKKFLYLSLTWLMVLSSTTFCMEQIIKADEEAQESALKVHGPTLPSKEGSIEAFLAGYSAVLNMGPHAIHSSPAFQEMKDARTALKAVNHGDKERTKEDLLGYDSDDERYFEQDEIPAEAILKRHTTHTGLAEKIQTLITENGNRTLGLQEEEESLNVALKQLYLKKAANRDAKQKNEKERIHFEQLQEIHASNKEQTFELLKSHKKELEEKLVGVEQRMQKYKQAAFVEFNQNTSQSTIIRAVSEQVATEESLLKEKEQLQTNLDKVDAALETILNPIVASTNVTPESKDCASAQKEEKKGWLSWF